MNIFKAMKPELETIRWPSNLDRTGIEARLGMARDLAATLGLTRIAARFADPRNMSPAEIAANVVETLAWLFDRPEHERCAHEALTRELEMVAMNLKNLK